MLVTEDHVQKVFIIRAEWDNDASIWSATSDDIPGLATEADSIEVLFNKLSSMIPELMFLNKVTDDNEIVYEVLARKSSVAHLPSEA
jgi:predicted RNase H-like HicB family nuclease